MASKDDGFTAGKILIEFIQSYCQVLEGQLAAVSSQINDTVAQLLKDVEEISANTANEKQFAEKVLDQTYLAPDADTQQFVYSAQAEVDSILEELSGGATDKISTNATQPPAFKQEKTIPGNGDSVSRLAGQFSKHMEVLSTMDSAMQNILFEIVGVLSRDDVICQRLLHVTDVTRATCVALSYVMTDMSGRFDLHNILKLRDDLLSYAWRRYTMESEKEVFKNSFAVPSVKKAS
jgi:hypothetical protein